MRPLTLRLASRVLALLGARERAHQLSLMAWLRETA